MFSTGSQKSRFPVSRRHKNTLSNIDVATAMRKQVNSLSQDTSISTSINTLIKYKINGLLTIDSNGQPVGVLSKTDILGAYYAALPIESPIEFIMSSPPLFCSMDDPLEHALTLMRDHHIYRLYVREPIEGRVVGALAYPDIVGMLYKHCHSCEYSHFRTKDRGRAAIRLRVLDSMNRGVKSVFETDSLIHVMEELFTYRLGAILVTDSRKRPTGVISKTDIILAYKRRKDPLEKAGSVMSTPIRCCREDDLVEDAIRTMIYSDIHRLFVKNPGTGTLKGVFSLSDAARNRSGSCRACLSSRITIQPDQA